MYNFIDKDIPMVFSKCSQVFMYHNNISVCLKHMIVPGENSNVNNILKPGLLSCMLKFQGYCI